MPSAAMRVSRKEKMMSPGETSHGLVEGIAGFVSIALGRPEVAAGDFVAVGLVLVDPPVAHSIRTLNNAALHSGTLRVVVAQVSMSDVAPLRAF